MSPFYWPPSLGYLESEMSPASSSTVIKAGTRTVVRFTGQDEFGTALLALHDSQ